MNKNKKERRLHYSAAAIGGFLGGFAIVNHHDIMGNAQTANLLSLTVSILGRDPLHVLLHVASMALYMLGLSLTVLIPKYTRWNLRPVSLAIDAVTMGILALMPSSTDDFVALYPIFFAMAFQWNSFKGADGYISSTIFSTNNLRQFTTSLTEYFCDRDKKHLHKTSFYGGTLLFFHVGAAVSCLASLKMGTTAALAGFLPVGISLFFLLSENNFLSLSKLQQRILGIFDNKYIEN